MTGKAIGITLNQGFLGSPSRLTPIPEIFTRPAGADIVFGDPAVLSNGKYIKYTTTNNITQLEGVICRGVQQSQLYTSQTGETGYKTNQPAAVLRKGFVIVASAGSPTAGGQVYLTSTGGFTATKGSNAAIPSARFTTGVKDGNGNAEIEIGYLPIFSSNV